VFELFVHSCHSALLCDMDIDLFAPLSLAKPRAGASPLLADTGRTPSPTGMRRAEVAVEVAVGMRYCPISSAPDPGGSRACQSEEPLHVELRTGGRLPGKRVRVKASHELASRPVPQLSACWRERERTADGAYQSGGIVRDSGRNRYRACRES
jgi:hypothetical protein